MKEQDPEFGKNHRFDDMDIFYRAFREAMLYKFEQLPLDQENVVYGHVYRLAECPQIDDSQWGEHNALENLPRLIDAMEALKN